MARYLTLVFCGGAILGLLLHPHPSFAQVKEGARKATDVPVPGGGGEARNDSPKRADITADPDSSSDAEKTVPVFHLRDQSRIAGFPKQESLEVKTQYGTLSVPLAEIVQIRLARRLPPELEKRIEGLIVDLGDADFDKREAATQALAGIGAPALTHLRKAAKSSSEEVKNRAVGLIAEIDKKSAESEPALPDDAIPALLGTEDEIITTRMTIRGQLLLDEFIVASNYGDLRVPVSDANAITFRSARTSSASLEVPAQSHAPNSWVDTKLEIDRGQRIKIDASGQISVNNYGIVSGPAGNTDWGGYTTFGNFPMLSLVGKVGKSGQPFLVGNGYAGKARNKGRLYLAVVPFSPYPTGAAGGYKVKVKTLGGD